MQRSVNKYLFYFFELDSRILSLFRISFGLVCVLDILRRFPHLPLFYSNEGILSNHFALFIQGSQSRFSLLFAFSSVPEVVFFFTLTLFSAVCFTLGYKTRLFHVLTFLGMLSIINRCRFTMYGGDSVILSLHLLSVFLPLNLHYSLDARATNRRQNPSTVYSIGIALLLLQLFAIYFVTALAKHGQGWKDGSIIYYLLHQDRIVTPLGLWVRDHVSYSLLQWLTWSAVYIEYIGAPLILSPIYKKHCRYSAFLLFTSLHLGIAAFTYLGVFSFVMISALVLLLPPSFLDWLDGLRVKESPKRDFQSVPLKSSPTLMARELYFLFIFLISSWMFFTSNSLALNTSRFPPLPKWIHQISHYLSYYQAWQMFAPDITHEDFKLVFDVELKDGTHIDPQNGRPPAFTPVSSTDMDWHQLWDAYTSQIWRQPWNQLSVELDRWLQERRYRLYIPPDAKIKSYQVFLIRDEAPPPPNLQKTKSQIVEKKLLWQYP